MCEVLFEKQLHYQRFDDTCVIFLFFDFDVLDQVLDKLNSAEADEFCAVLNSVRFTFRYRIDVSIESRFLLPLYIDNRCSY
jgi:hypothetical protein